MKRSRVVLPSDAGYKRSSVNFSRVDHVDHVKSIIETTDVTKK